MVEVIFMKRVKPLFAFYYFSALLWHIALTELLTNFSDEDVKIENDVYVLNKDNFDGFIKSKDTILVEFYAPWCGHCKNLAPHYEKAAKRLKQHEPPVYLAKVDCTVEKELSDRFEVTGYPTMKIFKREILIDYEGSREEDGIVDYMKDYSDPLFQFPKDETLTLTWMNFSEVTDREDFMVVLFYEAGCEQCDKLMVECEKVAKEFAKEKPPVLFATVNGSEQHDLVRSYSISEYPTLKLFRKGKNYPFNENGQDKWTLIEYINKHVGLGSHNITDMKILRSKISSREELYILVSFFNSSDDDSFKTYLDITNEKRDNYTFHHSFELSLRNAFNVDPSTFLLVHTEAFQSQYEPTWEQLKISVNSTALDVEEFIKNHRVPLVGEYNDKTKDKEYKERRPLVIFFYTVDWSFEYRHATQRWRKKFVEIAIKHPDMTFVVADDDSNKEIFSGFGFDDSGEEINVGIFSKEGYTYPMNPMDKFDSEEVDAFIMGFKKGNLKARLKSQNIPAKQSGPVFEVVGKSFEKIVLDPKKDVLIELYAPWCQHSTKFEPVYKQLAKVLKSRKNLVVTKMDATANDSPMNYLASKFPTIYFAPSNQKEFPLLYEGQTVLEDLMMFIEENAVASREDIKEEL